MANGDNRDSKPLDDCYGNSCVDIIVCRTESATVTLELKQPCGICGYIADNDVVYIDRNRREVHQYLCNSCASELNKNFKFLSVEVI